MIICGIDPGLATVGFAFLHKEGESFRVLDFGVIQTAAGLPMSERLSTMAVDLQALLSKHQPTRAGIEQLFFETNVKTAIQVAQARGVLLYTLQQQGLELIEPTPLQVKLAVTGDGRADKLQVQTMVQRTLGLATLPQPDDAADALAIALYAGVWRGY